MTTSTVESTPEQSEQKKQTAPAEVDKKAADEKAKQAADEKTKQTATRRRLILMIAADAVLIVAAILIWNIFFAPHIPKSIVVVSGRIEGDDSAVASKTTGRILEVRVREGDNVNEGDTIAVLDDAQIRAREDQARDTVSEAIAKGAAVQACGLHSPGHS